MRVTLIAATVLGVVHGISSVTPTWVWVARDLMVGFCALLAFGLIERWPARMRGWLARWVLQILAIVGVAPLAALLAYWVTQGGRPDFAHDKELLAGYGELTLSTILFGPWIAVSALVRQRDDFARDQASAFALERSQLERKAIDARLALLHAQVQPHFLFNTLANVQALVETGAPQAGRVLESLIEYLRAAIPRLHETSATLDQELQLASAYLAVMHMRMPDRLNYGFRVDAEVKTLQCPPMSLLTLVENSVRHGIDPSETGGRIDIEVRLQGSRCVVRVEDTGVGLRPNMQGPGTGLAALRERLQLAFQDDAQLSVIEISPKGVRAEMSFPARGASV